MSVTKRKFSPKFKYQLCRDIESSSKTIVECAREFSINESLIHKWLRLYRDNPHLAFNSSNSYSETQLLRRRISEFEASLGRKTLEVEILQKAIEKLTDDKKRAIFTD